MVGDQFQHGGGGFRDSGRDRNQEMTAAAIFRDQAQHLLQRDAFAAENIAMPDLPPLHGKHQARRDVAHVDQIDNEIEIQLQTLVEKMPEHGDRRRQVMIVRPDRHGRRADDDRKTGGRGFHRALLRQHLRAGIRARHVVGHRQGIIRAGFFAGR